ncbi:tRNA modification GTPase GTPBP3 [Neolentinus lepideus HHB14362 ss-1]|uniref:tRNA modification GTPase GTPBP3 n=1 Tax=Neolentinus lepideus HHB14362 ss-1 TaxID=1314782 RepID=A0A165P8G5_9AGAM|nr:tRNA modification GTPase GTPBP3 [Neolentinus lepideus HHB14362 ss-1]
MLPGNALLEASLRRFVVSRSFVTSCRQTALNGYRKISQILHPLQSYSKKGHSTNGLQATNTGFSSLALSDAQRRTIYALSTPPGKAGVAVVRISGPDAQDVWRRMVRLYNTNDRGREPRPWKMERCKVVHPESGETLDDGLAVFFKAPRSFTTEDVIELHVHSGRAVISSILSALSCFSACRPAEPGEFTRRAFEGGRLDLTQVEGLKDLIDAETETQRRLALDAAGGVSRARFEDLREGIIKSLAMVEAIIDFSETEDVEEGVFEEARARVIQLRSTIQRYLSDSRRGEILRSGIRLAIFGPPNAGKSSLLNFLAQREAAIVTSVPGTTRDILELSLDIGGLPVIVADTAGLRDTEDLVESIGVERARKMVLGADVALCVLSLPEALHRKDGGERCLKVPPMLEPLITPSTFFLLNKIDLVPSPTDVNGIEFNRSWTVSLSTGFGTKNFLDGFARALRERYDILQDTQSEQPVITHARHRVHLESALRFLEAFLSTAPEDVVLGAEELRYAARAVGRISGAIDVEDVLDSLFREFCIGK